MRIENTQQLTHAQGPQSLKLAQPLNISRERRISQSGAHLRLD